jgi:nucleoside-diphosphate-sugar epimerase
MKVLITGGGGFLGNQLARRLALRGELTGPSGKPERIDEIALFDVGFSPEAAAGLPTGTKLLKRNIGERDAIFDAVDRDDIAVFHLASMVSGECEVRFDDALHANLDGMRHLLEAFRQRAGIPRLVFASSVAAFGGEAMPDVVTDTTKQLPQTTYGMTKVISEMLINDYTRKGFLDGRSARLPTIIIRPGKPNTAASSWASGMFREPLNGQPCELPVGRSQAIPVLGYREVIDSFIALHEAPPESLGGDRAYGLPSLTITVEEGIGVLKKMAEERGITLGPIVDAPNAVIQKIVHGWPVRTDGTRAIKAGAPRSSSLEEIISYYITDFLS